MTVLYHLDSLQKARRPSAGGNYTYRQPLAFIVKKHQQLIKIFTNFTNK
jgi:hypothetical protein